MDGGNKLNVIDAESVHRICSGQVVVDLSTAIKELVENSLDAGAKKVEIKIKDYGKTFIQVADDGAGVEKENYANLARKHWTSKITKFDDLAQVRSFGFRGEALSSLCALSKLTVTTRTQKDKTATKLVYSPNGELVTASPTARACGTTVTVEDLFKSLPVRYREFQKNAKREFGKAVRVLQGYAIVCKNIRVLVHHQTKSRRNVVLKTEGSEQMRGNIIKVFGSKQASQLRRVQADFSTHFSESNPEDTMDVKIDGWVSKCDPNCGRCSSDRQFLFINGRPVDLPKISRMVNDIYHSFCNHKTYPIFCIDFELATDRYDINVTPNKRTVFIKDSQRLEGLVKRYFNDLFEPAANTYIVQTMDSFFKPKSTDIKKETLKKDITEDSVSDKNKENGGINQGAEEEMPEGGGAGGKRKLSQSEVEDSSSLIAIDTESPTDKEGGNIEQLDSTNFRFRKRLRRKKVSEEDTHDDENNENDEGGLSNMVVVESESSDVTVDIETGQSDELVNQSKRSSTNDDSEMEDAERAQMEKPKKQWSIESKGNEQDTKSINDALVVQSPPKFKTAVIEEESYAQPSEGVEIEQDSFIPPSESIVAEDTTLPAESNTIEDIKEIEEKSDIQELEHSTKDAEADCQLTDKETCEPNKHAEIVENKSIYFDLNAVRNLMEGIEEGADAKALSSLPKPYEELSQLGANDKSAQIMAEGTMRRVIQKSDFLKMGIVGQFNLGFIITKLNEDLFIIDQHATDEKFQFEKLQRTTRIHSQVLFRPMPVKVSPAHFLIILDHIDVFRANGFDFCGPAVEEMKANTTKSSEVATTDGDHAEGCRLFLRKIPFSKSTTFGMDDVTQLCTLLSDAGGGEIMNSDEMGTADAEDRAPRAPSHLRNLRIPKLRAMFASRACRSSVMIGTALQRVKMRKLVRNMGTMSHPWNCPHGRPTMRHLFHLGSLNMDP